jgi:hypothetical protein
VWKSNGLKISILRFELAEINVAVFVID